MSKSVEIIACPVCRTELSLEQITGHLDDERAFARLVALTVPMARSVVQYIGLFTPPRQILTLRKKVRLIQQLLPDLSRCAITHRGRDWAAPPAAWEQAIEQMLAARDAGRLDLPMKSHAYLYTILMGMADKAEGAAEAQALVERQQAARAVPAAATVHVRGQAMTIGGLLGSDTHFAAPPGGAPVGRAVGPANWGSDPKNPGRDPALVKAEADARNAAPMPAAVREMIAARRGTKPTNQDTEGPTP